VTAVPEDGDEAEGGQQLERRQVRGPDPGGGHRAVEHVVGLGGQPAGLGLLGPVALDHPDAGHRLLHDLGQLGQLLLEAHDLGVQAGGEALGQDVDQRQGTQGQQRQVGVGGEQDHRDRQHRDGVGQRQRDHHEEELDLLQVGVGAAHQLAGGRLVVVPEVQPGEVLEQAATQVGLDPAGHPEGVPPADAAAGGGHHAGPEDQEPGPTQRGAVVLADALVDPVLGDAGHADLGRGPDHADQHPEGQPPPRLPGRRQQEPPPGRRRGGGVGHLLQPTVHLRDRSLGLFRRVAPVTSPPVAKRVPFERTRHGETVVDEYAWLRDRDDPATSAYLEAENAYTAEVMAPTEVLQQELFTEIRSRIQETDLTVPARKGSWWYFARTEEDRQYAIHCRSRSEDGDGEVVMLDQNVVAGESEFFALGAFDITPDARLLAYSTDFAGAELYTMRFRDLESGEELDDQLEGTYYGTAWAADSTTFFYVRPDGAMRPYQLWRHRLGSPATDDVLVYEEPDERFFLSVGTTKDDRYVVLHLGSKVTDEVHVLPADDPTGDFQVVEPRQQDVEYSLEHWRDRFYIVTNVDGAEDFKLVEAPESSPGRASWRDVVPSRPGTTLTGIDVFADHLVLFERAEGLRRIRVREQATGEEHVIEQPEAVSTASGGTNPEFDSAVLRYGYTSMVTPGSVYDYDLRTRERTLKKRQPVLGGYDPEEYATERVWATADDGTQVPISLVYKRGRPQDGTAPALLYGYGSYEASMDPGFSSLRLSLLDRGFVFAIAHIRGGGELGRAWYRAGKLLEKRNTFTDFVACARHLVAEGWTSPEKLAIRGGSAGGLLVGAVLNLAPDAMGAAVAEVPFVDALNTILDPSLPLTVMEWEEWGNPVESAEVYRYMRSYAPYENVEAKAYPPILATAGLNDPRVSYWEPAKWVARLRTTKAGDSRLLLKTEMGAGHMGPSGRYDAWKDEAFVFAFILDTLGVSAVRRDPQ
jgi:oligopeptidase B